MLNYLVGHAMAASNSNFGTFSSLFSLNTLTSKGDNPQGISTVENLIISAINWFLAIVALIAVVYLVLYGVKYITSGGDAAKATEARNGIINAIIGIVVIVLAFFIVRVAVSLGGSISTGGGTVNP